MTKLPEALLPLTAFKQFLVYRVSPSKSRPGKTDKKPVNCQTGVVDNAHNPDIWVDSPTAIAVATALGPNHGVGFVLTDSDPFFMVDVDDCTNPDGSWNSVAIEMVNRFPGAAVEVSQSGTGLHIIGSAFTSDHGHKHHPTHSELYSTARMISLTGTGIYGSAAQECTTAFSALVHDYFPPVANIGAEGWTSEPCAEWNGIEDDDQLIARACKSAGAGSVMGNKASFNDLWERNLDKLQDAYPDEERDDGVDWSKADRALTQHLAFWTGKNCDRILRLMWRSALVRDKWTWHKTYLTTTIGTAVAVQGDVHSPGSNVDVPESVVVKEPELVSGFQFMSTTQQLEYFKGCVYVQDQQKAFTIDGGLLSPDRFKSTYGGYVFALHSSNDKTSKNAWEIFTESQAIRFPKSNATCFRPQLETGEFLHEEGRWLVNTYVPIDTPSMAGDVTPFLDHLKKVLPDERDQLILLSYMAACIQYKGIKFDWAPLIQGVPGNGKTLFTRCVKYAVGRRYTHMPKADDIDNKFNAWLMNKLFIGVEDIYVPEHRNRVIEALKPMITGGDDIEIQMKGVDQVTADICCNFIFNSNHRDAIKLTRDDRRFAVFYTAQQTLDDYHRDGMGGDYFPKLYGWLHGDGYAIVNDFLSNYSIPDEHNPTTLSRRAPTTTSSADAVMASMGIVEQEILEAISAEHTGFRGGWVSSIWLDRLILVALNAGLLGLREFDL